MSQVLGQAHLDVLTEVSARKRVWQHVRAHLDKAHAIDFNAFDFLRRDELGLSEVLRWLLDPEASHGQRDTFLREFLNYCDISERQLPTQMAIAETEIATRWIEQSQRRIDVHVRCGDFILAIENKPFASYQRDQLRDYLRHLEAVAPGRHCLVVLSSSATSIPRDQLTEAEWDTFAGNNRLVSRTYGDLGAWLRRCEAGCEAPRVRQMLSEFRDYIQAQFGNGGRMADREFIIEGILEDPAKISASLELLAVGDDLQESLLRDFVKELDKVVTARGWTASIDETLADWPIMVDFGDPNWAFGLEIYWTADKPFFGMITKRRAKNAKHPKAKIAAIEAAFGKSRPNGWLWPWWQHFDKATLPGLIPTDLVSVWREVHQKSRLIDWVIGQCARAKKALT